MNTKQQFPYHHNCAKTQWYCVFQTRHIDLYACVFCMPHTHIVDPQQERYNYHKIYFACVACIISATSHRFSPYDLLTKFSHFFDPMKLIIKFKNTYKPTTIVLTFCCTICICM